MLFGTLSSVVIRQAKKRCFLDTLLERDPRREMVASSVSEGFGPHASYDHATRRECCTSALGHTGSGGSTPSWVRDIDGVAAAV